MFPRFSTPKKAKKVKLLKIHPRSSWCIAHDIKFCEPSIEDPHESASFSSTKLTLKSPYALSLNAIYILWAPIKAAEVTSNHGLALKTWTICLLFLKKFYYLTYKKFRSRSTLLSKRIVWICGWKALTYSRTSLIKLDCERSCLIRN